LKKIRDKECPSDNKCSWAYAPANEKPRLIVTVFCPQPNGSSFVSLIFPKSDGNEGRQSGINGAKAQAQAQGFDGSDCNIFAVYGVGSGEKLANWLNDEEKAAEEDDDLLGLDEDDGSDATSASNLDLQETRKKLEEFSASEVSAMTGRGKYAALANCGNIIGGVYYADDRQAAHLKAKDWQAKNTECDFKPAVAEVGKDKLFVVVVCVQPNEDKLAAVIVTKEDEDQGREYGLKAGIKMFSDEGYSTARCFNASVFGVASGKRLRN
jgi:hypothetical protein